MSTIEEILASPDQKEIVVEIDSIKRSDYIGKTWYYTTSFRESGPDDVPANTVFRQYLHPEFSSLGPLSQALSEDLLSGLAEINPGTLVLVQSDISSDQISQFHDYIFAGSEVRVKIGLATSVAYTASSFPLFATLTIKVDPSINLTQHGIEASFPLSSAVERMLGKSIGTKHYRGIPHCAHFLTSAGYASRAHSSVHSLTSFTAVVTFKTPSSAAGTMALFRKQTSVTNCNWSIRLLASGVISGVSSTGAAQDVLIESTVSYADDAWHTAVLGRTLSFAYLMVDGSIIGTATPTGTTDTPSAAIEIGTYAGTDRYIQDCRLYDRYLWPEEARSLTQSRTDGTELGCVALWRFDDNTGTTVTDYSASNLSATLNGTENTAWKWDYSDLGEPELAGRPYPISVGEVFNAEAQLIDTQRARYRGNVDATDWHTSVSNTTLVVKSRGTVLTSGVDYTAPSNGGDGVFSTTSAEDAPVTFDLTKNSTDVSDASYLSVVGPGVMQRSDTAINVDTAQGARISILCPWKSGWRTDQDTTVGSALGEIYGESGLCYYESTSGALFVDVLQPPIGPGPYGSPCVYFAGASGLGFGDTGSIVGSGTVACWFIAHTVNQSATAIPYSDFVLVTKAPNFHFYLVTSGSNAGKLAFTIGGQTTFSLAGQIEINKWYFAAAIFDDSSNTVRLYIARPGQTLVEIGSAANTNTPSTNTDPIYVGGVDTYLWGSIQAPQVWSSASTLTALQNQASLSVLVGNESNLIFYPSMDEGSGAPIDAISDWDTALLEPQRWAPRLTVNLATTPSVVLSDFHRLDPAGEIIVQYGRNWRPMSASDVDTGVSQNAALDLKREWREVGAQDLDILANYKHAKKIRLESALTTRQGAEKLYWMLVRRFSEDRWIGKLTFPPGLEVSIRACGLRLMDEIKIIAAIPSQLASGRSFRVIAVAPDLLNLSTTIVFWG